MPSLSYIKRKGQVMNMKTITVNSNEYKLEFSFEAAEYKDIVQKMFKVISGAYVVEESKDMQNPTTKDIINSKYDWRYSRYLRYCFLCRLIRK